jgi:DHA3 family macrolide efflux protein-like MFS transporter
MQASTSLMVPNEHLSRIQGLNQMLMGGLNIVSAPLGALLLEVLPMQGVLAIDVGTAMLAIVPLFFFAIPQPTNGKSGQAGEAKTSVWDDFRAGLRYASGWPGLVMIGIMATIINFLLNPAFSLLPILVFKHFDGQAIQLAYMESAWGIGVVVGGVILSAWGGFKRRLITSMVGLLGIGAGCLVIGLLPPSALYPAIATMFFLGIANPITNGPLMAAVQAAVSPEMQGRIFTLIGSVAAAMSPLGLIMAGPVADSLGVQTWFILGGVVTGLMGVIGFFIPAVMRFEDGRPGATPEISLGTNEPASLVPSPVEVEIN